MRTTAHSRRMHAASGGTGRMHAGTANVNRRRRRRRRNNPIANVAGKRRRDNSTAAVGPLLGVGRTALTLPPAGGGRAFFAVPPRATVRQWAGDVACVLQRSAERRVCNGVQWQRADGSSQQHDCNGRQLLQPAEVAVQRAAVDSYFLLTCGIFTQALCTR